MTGVDFRSSMAVDMKHDLIENEVRRQSNAPDWSWFGDALGVVFDGLECLLSIFL